eukprot:CAMPEP_0195054318 /NCGR_PEP_ID=MMETSP0448-20130528/3279_1 /TAXON_ID=66468 /ORGANISM="Heterocapsa triquestra, Strain CCMP 448" /LENGTH=80 /DNA_ID=CAMNT_0040083795 /DNA_START=15 /DNA_END=253 /DNA_ORIENTATION=+
MKHHGQLAAVPCAARQSARARRRHRRARKAPSRRAATWAAKCPPSPARRRAHPPAGPCQSKPPPSLSPSQPDTVDGRDKP